MGLERHREMGATPRAVIFLPDNGRDPDVRLGLRRLPNGNAVVIYDPADPLRGHGFLNGPEAGESP
jgi:hypothetical protein